MWIYFCSARARIQSAGQRSKLLFPDFSETYAWVVGVDSQFFSKCFLGFDVNIALALVEGVSAVADDVGPDGHPLAFFAACPNFCGVEKFCACAQAPVALRHD